MDYDQINVMIAVLLLVITVGQLIALLLQTRNPDLLTKWRLENRKQMELLETLFQRETPERKKLFYAILSVSDTLDEFFVMLKPLTDFLKDVQNPGVNGFDHDEEDKDR